MMQETRVRSLGWEDPLEEGMTTLKNIYLLAVLGLSCYIQALSCGMWDLVP